MTLSVNGVGSNYGCTPQKLSFKSSNDEKQDGGIKKQLTLKNTVLGSLATLGVLGMVDILIFKGKHISKLTGKDKYIPEFFNPNKFDRAAFDANIDRTIPEIVKKLFDTNAKSQYITWKNRTFFFEDGKLCKLIHYDPKTNVSKVEKIATENLYEELRLKDCTVVRGKDYKIGDVMDEAYYLGKFEPKCFSHPTSLESRGCRSALCYREIEHSNR